MSILNSIDKHLTSINKFNAYTYWQAIKQFFLFPYDYYFRDGKSLAPMNIALFLTLRCNAKCFMCNLQELINNDPRELSLEKIDALLKEIAPSKPSIVLFGGEPIIRTDFVDILKKVKSYGLSCGIFTNGTLFTPEKIKQIIDAEMNYVAFSLQGIGTEHDKIVGIDGAYEKMIRNIREFTKYKKRKTKIVIHTTISESNLDELAKVVKLGEELGVDLIRFGHPTFFTDFDIQRNKNAMRSLFPEEKIDEISYSYDPKEKSAVYYDKISGFMKKYAGRFKTTPDLSLDEIKDWYSSNFKSKRKCYFVWRGCFIYPNGDMVPCESIKIIMGNINEQPFMKIWNSPKYVKFRKTLKKGLLPACARCCKL